MKILKENYPTFDLATKIFIKENSDLIDESRWEDLLAKAIYHTIPLFLDVVYILSDIGVDVNEPLINLLKNSPFKSFSWFVRDSYTTKNPATLTNAIEYTYDCDDPLINAIAAYKKLAIKATIIYNGLRNVRCFDKYLNPGQDIISEIQTQNWNVSKITEFMRSRSLILVNQSGDMVSDDQVAIFKYLSSLNTGKFYIWITAPEGFIQVQDRKGIYKNIVKLDLASKMKYPYACVNAEWAKDSDVPNFLEELSDVLKKFLINYLSEA